MFLKVIACEIAFRELSHLAAQAPNLIDLDFLTQGHHDTPSEGRRDIQERIDALPDGKYDAVLLGYGLCSSILPGLRARKLPLIVPRAHDCITFFLGSKERYQKCFTERPGTYYFTSGWLECRTRRGKSLPAGHGAFLPAHSPSTRQADYEAWVAKYGREKADYLMEVMGGWSQHYTHGTLIDFDFARPLALDQEVQRICQAQGWQYEQARGDLSLLRRWLAGDWPDTDFLRVEPGQQIAATSDDRIIEGVSPHY
ncbi:MAG: DUF1638 domain-containing protein [Verrucomicrobiales bacterium]|nr:DUF1638 domain-containing protein [Verrucomicrobiales bacterium]MCP5527800.1 DUF1638 domain-containing protein [Verrucomicrobiales bacterium]